MTPTRSSSNLAPWPVAVLLAFVLALWSALTPAAHAQGGDERIIVSGASGALGTLVVDGLLAEGVDPRNLILVSRSPDELARYAALGAATRFGDFTQPESLASAYEGGDRMLLISMSAGMENRHLLHGNAVSAAAQAGVKHIVYTSTVDADNMDPAAASADMHRRTEQIIRDSGLQWTMLRNHMYANGLVRQAARMVADGRVVVQPDEVPTAYVTREDCAAAAVAVLIGEGHANRIYDITGPSTVLRRDVARLAAELSGVPVDIVEGPGGVPQVTGPTAGFNSFLITSDAVERLTGRPATSVESLLRANADQLSR